MPYYTMHACIYAINGWGIVPAGAYALRHTGHQAAGMCSSIYALRLSCMGAHSYRMLASTSTPPKPCISPEPHHASLGTLYILELQPAHNSNMYG